MRLLLRAAGGGLLVAALPSCLSGPAASSGARSDSSPSESRQTSSRQIRLDQVGYYPSASKTATVVDADAGTFAVLTADGRDTVLAGTLSAPERWAPSGEVVRRADFGALVRPGRYVLAVPGLGSSDVFVVAPEAMRELARASLKAFYFQRASTPLPEEFAGRWSRPAGHPDDSVLVHPSAAGPTRPPGARVAAPGGWYDAGDYNKYIVNSGISTYTVLAITEHFPDYAAALGTNIPESANAIPDALDEALWNLRWMLTMQDPADGGVYHKLTNAEFEGFVMPDEAVAPRYVVQKSTAATLDLAAVAAHAALVVRSFPRELPGLPDTLMRAATAAWTWARQHPDSLYDQERLATLFTPAIRTGTYGDRELRDEFRWAAAELYLATGQDSFLVAAEPLAPPAPSVPGWSSVRALGLYSLIEHRGKLPEGFDVAALERRLLDWTGQLLGRAQASPYGVAMGERDFVWGSNSVVANQGMAFIQAYRLSGDRAYLHAAAASLDYLLGRNALAMSFVTGHGARTPRWPHHRPSQADTVTAPVPGMLVGGPNPGQQDRCAGYPSRLPAVSYVDSTCSYAANEIAINWNAPLAYLAVAVDAAFSSQGSAVEP